MTNAQIIQATKELNELLKAYTELQQLYKQMCFAEMQPKERVEKVLHNIEEAIEKIVGRIDLEWIEIDLDAVQLQEVPREKRRKVRL